MRNPTDLQRLAARVPDNRARLAMFQTWRDLLFLHWEFPVEVIQATLPPGLTVDTFEGRAYVGIVPFFMDNVRPRFCPALPWVSNFLELNVRTYVHDDCGTPGVWFYSLDANQPIAVAAAQTFFHLPYHYASMSASKDNGKIDYHLRPKTQPESRYRYLRCQNGVPAEPGTLEFFLLERYYLFAFHKRRNTLMKGQVHHRPYEFELREQNPESTSPLKRVHLTPDSDIPVHAAVARDVSVSLYGLTSV